MAKKRLCVVTTTIHEGEFVDNYAMDFRAQDEVDAAMIVIPDEKTPESAYDVCRRNGVACPTLEQQDAFLDKIGMGRDFVPRNSDNRRNVGFLMALEAGHDVVVSIDDDNYCAGDGSFTRRHASMRVAGNDGVVQTSDGWYNPCAELGLASDVYPRGFPYSLRHARIVGVGGAYDMESRPLSVNVGLWTVDPDVDAMTRLTLAPRVLSSRQVRSVILGDDVWCPINTQNTAMTRDALMAYWYVRMTHTIAGIRMDRFGDILSGYFLRWCAREVGAAIRVGDPLVEHWRTQHDLLADAYHEIPGVMLVETLAPWLRETRVGAAPFVYAYEALAQELSRASHELVGKAWDAGGREFLRDTAQSMGRWSRVARQFA